MTLNLRDEATNMRRGVIRWPHGTSPTPFGCRWCGRQRGAHANLWVPSVRWHTWVRPTDAQILARMRARRKIRNATRMIDRSHAQYHNDLLVTILARTGKLRAAMQSIQASWPMDPDDVED